MMTKINKKSIRNILTIRYDPLNKQNIKLHTVSDLYHSESDSEGIKTEKLLRHVANELLSNNKRSFSVSLSGGIDSTLSLAISRKIAPNAKIKGICAVFEESFDESKTAKKIRGNHLRGGMLLVCGGGIPKLGWGGIRSIRLCRWADKEPLL